MTLGPQRMGESWKVRSASISTTSTVETTCRMYRNAVSSSTFIDGTSTANLNVSNVGSELANLERLVFVFTGGDFNKTATVVLDGTMTSSR
ncbi:MAG TPA: hypothetical protein VFI97_03640 [Arthrobacter sp.]|nr:hypothetical protein [Arthrobacter sp.]